MIIDPPAKVFSKKNINGLFDRSNVSTTTTAESRAVVQQVQADYVALSNITLSGDQSIDGANRSDGDIILVPNQTDKEENGVYEYDSSGAWSRIAVLEQNRLITVNSGDTKNDTLWMVTKYYETNKEIEFEELPLYRRAGDIDTFTGVTPADADVGLLEDNSDSNNKKKFTFSNLYFYLKGKFNSDYLKRSASDFSTFTSVTPTGSDIVLIEDASDSNNKKKITVQGIVNLAGSEIDNSDVSFVSPSYSEAGIYYNDLSTAISSTSAGGTLFIFPGTYTGNYSISKELHLIFLKGAELTPTTKTSPALTFTNASGGSTVKGHLVANYIPSSGYIIDVGDATVDIEAEDVGYLTDSGTPVNALTINSAKSHLIKVDKLGFTDIVAAGTNVFLKGQQSLGLNNDSSADVDFDFQFLNWHITNTAGSMTVKFQRNEMTATKLLDVVGGTMRASGFADAYGAATAPIQVGALGTFKGFDLRVKNGSNLVMNLDGTAILGDVIFESGDPGGGAVASIQGTGNVIYSGKFDTNVTPSGITETIPLNRNANVSVQI